LACVDFRHRRLRITAIAVLLLFAGLSIGAMWFAPDYATQNRDCIQQNPSWKYPLGTDELGRDNLSRLLSGLRLSLLLSTLAAACACALALLFGAVSGLAGGFVETILLHSINLVESVPWLFLFLTVRALLPLNVSPSASIWLTFALLAALGWTHAARVLQASVREIRHSEALVYARACGIAGWRLWVYQALPGLRRVSLTQFTILIPTFILAEAGLGLLGLGVSEPLPSLGNLLRQLEKPELVHAHPLVLTPLLVLLLVILSLRTVSGDLEVTA
jgi:ABC-type dipeptide/oligopeptide/nickel transport system permease subunit